MTKKLRKKSMAATIHDVAALAGTSIMTVSRVVNGKKNVSKTMRDIVMKAVEELKALFPAGADLAAMALRWVLMFPEVSTVIPGASRVEQVAPNLAAANGRALTAEEMAGVKAVYDKHIKPLVHHLW